MFKVIGVQRSWYEVLLFALVVSYQSFVDDHISSCVLVGVGHIIRICFKVLISIWGQADVLKIITLG